MPGQTTLKISFPLTPDQQELAIAVLGELAFYAFEETPEALLAYIYQDDFQVKPIEATLHQYFADQSIEYVVEALPNKDWNAAWEKEFKGVRVEDFCEILPPFKTPAPEVQHHVLIHPKMAFGTGHHATTRLMSLQMKHLDLKGKKVLDMGTGTGVLGILASKLGAQQVTGIDIDEWSYQNALENIALNEINNMEILLGDRTNIPGDSFDVIFANINRNVLVADLPIYVDRLVPGGFLVLSGFFHSDITDLTTHAQQSGLVPVGQKEDQEWASLVFQLENK